MKKFLIFILGFFIGIIIFAPKDNLYFTFQKFLKKENIYINSNINSNLINLKLDNGVVYYNNMDLIKFREIKVLPLLLFNEIKANDIKLNIGNYVIKNLNIIYHIFNPLNVSITGDSNFGKIEGKIDLVKRHLKVYVKLTNNNLKSFLQRDKKGYFYYAKF